MLSLFSGRSRRAGYRTASPRHRRRVLFLSLAVCLSVAPNGMGSGSALATFDDLMCPTSLAYPSHPVLVKTPQDAFVQVSTRCITHPLYGAVVPSRSSFVSFNFVYSTASGVTFTLINGPIGKHKFTIDAWHPDNQRTRSTIELNKNQSVTVAVPGSDVMSVTVSTWYHPPYEDWTFYVDNIAWSFENDQVDTVPVQAVHSPNGAPKADDTLAVADTGPGLDTRCTFRSGGPLEIDIPVNRVVTGVGGVDSAGRLLAPGPLIALQYLSAKARIRVAAYDVDEDEIDRVYLNGNYLGRLEGEHNKWSTNEFVVPVESVRFGRNAAGVNAPGMNTLRIEIDESANPARRRCTSVDWASIGFDAIAPILLVHGTDAGPSTWDDGVHEFLRTQNIPFSDPENLGGIRLEPNGSIRTNGALLAVRVRELARAFGAKSVHLVAHSKGGNDSREFLTVHYNPEKPDPRVLSLYTLSTPFHGTVVADIIFESRTKNIRGTGRSANPFIADIIAKDYWFVGLTGPHGDALDNNRVSFMTEEYNEEHPFPSSWLRFYNFGADADTDNDWSITTEERTPIIPDYPFVGGLLDNAAHSLYYALGTVRTVEVRDRIIYDSTGRPVGAIPMIELAQSVGPQFQQNDLVVTVTSAHHPSATPLGQLDANHSNMKSRSMMQGILYRIRADFPVTDP